MRVDKAVSRCQWQAVSGGGAFLVRVGACPPTLSSVTLSSLARSWRWVGGLRRLGLGAVVRACMAWWARASRPAMQDDVQPQCLPLTLQRTYHTHS